jgi:hypothetical protein
MNGRVLHPEFDMTPLWLPENAANPTFDTFHRIELDLCYRSVLDECWELSKGRDTVAVPSCSPAPVQFQD